MLILIAGATGDFGQELITSALSRHHTVRGLGRNPDKISSNLLDRLESFFQIENYYDIPALHRACAGVDAIICAYTGLPELQLDAQLLLLRAAERAGVSKFVASSWNYDWRNLQLGQQESYDPFICFHRQAELSSPIKPIYILTGVFAEVLFTSLFTVKNNGIWDPENKQFVTYGTDDQVWHVTTYADAAAFTIEVLQSPRSENGGFFNFASFVHSTREIANIYGAVRGIKVPIVLKGTVQELRERAIAARKEIGVRNFFQYIGLFYQLHTLEGTWILKSLQDKDYPGAPKTSLERFLVDNPEL